MCSPEKCPRMLRGFFGSGKKQGKPKADSFRTVLGTPWTLEYSGSLPALAELGVRHRMVCSEVTPEAARALLDQGFQSLGTGGIPTHAIFCTASLYKDRYQPRLLFNVFIDLSIVSSAAWRTWIAVQVCQGLKKRLLTCTERSLLIRCKSEHEFDWCIDDVTLDFAWLDDGNRYLRSALQEYESIRQV